jgi:predicted TIM-barrel fold metal-dependent hydrolase
MNTLPYRVVDSHVHLYKSHTEIEGLIEILDQSGYAAINLACIPSGLIHYHDVNGASLLCKALNPGRVFMFAGLDYSAGGAKEGSVDFSEQAKLMLELGADGFKMLEGKTTTRKASGIPLDSPMYDSFYGLLEKQNVPLLLHVADPEEFWDAEKAPAWAKEHGWFYGDGTFPSKEQLYTEAENVLKKFPGLKVTFAHFFFMSADSKRAARFLDTYPNVCFDLAPGSEMFTNFGQKPDEWRIFFNRYQDRILYGTDNSMESWDEKTPLVNSLDRWVRMRRFLETDQGFDTGKGLRLGPSVVRKIYSMNFERVTGRRPKRVDLERSIMHCLKRADMALASNRKEIAGELGAVAARMRTVKG